MQSDRLNQEAAYYLKLFMNCEGLEIQSRLALDQNETKQLKNSTGHVLAEKNSKS